MNRMYENMLLAARERLRGKDFLKTAAQTGMDFDGKTFNFLSLGREISVDSDGFSVKNAVDDWHKLVILHYLDLADGVPLSGKLIPFSAQRDGMIRGGEFDRQAEKRISAAFSSMEHAEAKCRLFSAGARFMDSNADLCAIFDFLPRYPIILKLWLADEEFPASGRLFLDESAEHYLTVEDSVTAGEIVLQLLEG